MKKLMMIAVLIAFVAIPAEVSAQGWLGRLGGSVVDRAKSKAESKVDQAVDKAVDKAEDEATDAVKGKKDKNKKSKNEEADETPVETADNNPTTPKRYTDGYDYGNGTTTNQFIDPLTTPVTDENALPECPHWPYGEDTNSDGVIDQYQCLIYDPYYDKYYNKELKVFKETREQNKKLIINEIEKMLLEVIEC